MRQGTIVKVKKGTKIGASGPFSQDEAVTMADDSSGTPTIGNPRILACCFCSLVLEPAFPSTPYAEALGATSFTSHGGYGSGLFDPSHVDGRYLELNICDDCLSAAVARHAVNVCSPQTTTVVDRTEFDPQGEDW